MSWTRQTVLVISIVLANIGLDQFTKEIALDKLKGEQPISMLGGLARLIYAENRGAMLSLGTDLSEETRFWIFQAGVGIVLLGMLGFSLLRRDLTKLQLWGVSCLVGGGIGNLIDRCFRDGAVIDFMILGKDWWKTGIFNVADIAIMAGCGVLILSTFQTPPDQPAPEPI